ncbi:hypothetical protein GQ600_10939 [Phytophthora cactorum]|nr:hypothetical protein GQ600_10939 [Phytophthora cactorum]
MATTPDANIGERGALNRVVNAPSHQYLRMRTRAMSDDISEERAMPGAAKLQNLAKSGAQNLKNLASSAKQKLLSNNQKATDKLFARLEGGTAQPKLFETTSYQTCVAKAADNTQNIAKKVERAQLINWLSNGKTVDDAITLLRLNTGEGGELLKNPALSTWFSYVKMTKQNPDELSFLKLKTRFSDEELATMIAVTRDAKAWIYLEGLARVQLNNWLRMDKTADGIFNVLILNKEGTHFLKARS